MYRILILDDERRFLGVEADEIVHVEHSWDAIRELRTCFWNEIWLDFDLGGDDKGSNVCRYIRDQAQSDGLEFWGTTFYIHSFNSAGRSSMKQILKDAGIKAVMTDLRMFELKPRKTSFV